MRRNLLATLLVLGCAIASQATPAEYFAIHVVDDVTGRGVPLVKLTTVNQVSCWTDSGGLVAFHEPGLMDQEVFFHISSDGYEYPKDMFDNRGVKLRPVAGGEATIKIKRLDIAERLYRITGGGIYRDTLLLGRRAPLSQPVLNGEVLGQDTVIAAPYRGKIYWFWGDTDKPSYPLGNFSASGATSELPAQGGLDPNVGVDFAYFIDQNGFCRPMCPDFGPGLQWIESVMTLSDPQGRERLFARVASAAGLDGAHAWHLAVFNDEQQHFESIVRWDLHDTHDAATTFRARVGAEDYVYLYPNLRVKADVASLRNLDAYEAFTCLAPGTRFAGKDSKLNRDADGRLHYVWRRGAERLNTSRQNELIDAGLLQPAEAWRRLRDIETGRLIETSRGSVCWNRFRNRWVMITAGSAGEIWFAEADTPVGPWLYARRIVTHEAYNFYNPTQHSFFDQQDGRVIFFEGTYTASFSNAKEKTPRYDYNQIMYRLDLADERLALPVPIYSARRPDGSSRLITRAEIEAEGAWPQIESIAFLALPASRIRTDAIPIYADNENGGTVLRRESKHSKPLFSAVSTPASSRLLVPLREFRDPKTGRLSYSIEESTDKDDRRVTEPLCWVWRSPVTFPILDPVTPSTP